MEGLVVSTVSGPSCNHAVALVVVCHRRVVHTTRIVMYFMVELIVV